MSDKIQQYSFNEDGGIDGVDYIPTPISSDTDLLKELITINTQIRNGLILLLNLLDTLPGSGYSVSDLDE